MTTKKNNNELPKEMKNLFNNNNDIDLMNNNKILTEEEVEELGEFLEENKSEDAKFIESLPSNNGILETTDNELDDIITEQKVSINSNDGSYMSLDNEVDKQLAKMLDINIEDFYDMPKSAADIPYDEELIKANALNYGVKDADMIILLPLINDYRAGKKINYYNSLPVKIKNMINKQCAMSNNNTVWAKKLFAEELIQGLIRDAGIDKITIDLQEVTKKAFGEGISGIMKMTLDYQKTILETKFLENINRLYAEGKPEKAEHLKKVTESYRQSYTFENFTSTAKCGKLRVKDFDLKKYGRYISEFNYKYETDTPFIINDISGIAPVLARKFDGIYSVQQIMIFIIAFCKFCQNMDAKDVIDHTFMSYAIINIASLDLVINDQEENAFINTLSANIDAAIKAANNIKEEE